MRVWISALKCECSDITLCSDIITMISSCRDGTFGFLPSRYVSESVLLDKCVCIIYHVVHSVMVHDSEVLLIFSIHRDNFPVLSISL